MKVDDSFLLDGKKYEVIEVSNRGMEAVYYPTDDELADKQLNRGATKPLTGEVER